MPTLQQLFRRKPVPEMSAETGSDSDTSELARSIGLFQLSVFGIGATIGTGIFFVLAEAVPVAGPAVILSFVLAGAVAGLTAVCYAELASAVPYRALPTPTPTPPWARSPRSAWQPACSSSTACRRRPWRWAGRSTSTSSSTTSSTTRSPPRGQRRPKRADATLMLPAATRSWPHALHGRPAAHPWRKRVGDGQRRDGHDQDRGAGHVHRDRSVRLGLRQPDPVRCRSASRA